MLKTPIDFLLNNSVPVRCSDPLPPGTYPLPRCISNEFAYNLGSYVNSSYISRQETLRSKRRTNHMATWFGQYISFDITTSTTSIPSTPIYIPADDATFNPPSSIPGELLAEGITSLPFNLSDTLPGTPNPLNSVRNGISQVSPFIDLSTIYGISDDLALRDGVSCKLLTSSNGKYPPKDTNGNYIKSAATSSRSWTLFTLAISTIWIREHNRLCEDLFNQHGYSWTNQQYFEEAKRWNIAFFQKTISEEYLGSILGRPLPPYRGYNPSSIPGIDTFFATVSFRYGHSELSDLYRIQDIYGGTMVELKLNETKNEDLLETLSLDRVLGSMILQRQEEVDVFFSDASRNINMTHVYDLYAFDVSRSRDRGIALYNVARKAYGLPRKNTWNEITSNKSISDRLQLLYPNGPDTMEALVGAYCEDHLDGSNFGELFNASIVTQFNRIRETDKLWWESPEAFNDTERVILRNTTFSKIITRNLVTDGIDISQFVSNIWTVQPYSEPNNGTKEKNISPWTAYTITYTMDNSHIHFQVELKTTGGEGWFGMGFDPSDDGMTNAEFIVGIVKNNDIDLSNYNSDGGYHPPLRQSPEGLQITSKSVDPDGVAKIEFSRLLTPPNRKPIRRGQMKYIMAYSPITSFSYHGANRQMSLINFYDGEISSADITKLQKNNYLYHGIGMFLTWCVLSPISIFVVRFRKHTYNYLRIHRNMQLLSGISVSSFGAAAIATMTGTKSPHAWTGLVIYVLTFFELGLGLLSIWGQAAVVSVNQGYPRFTKRVHKVFGVVLILSAWVNIYLGIDTFTLSYSYNPIYWKVGYAIWAFALVVIFVVGEYWWRKEGSFHAEEDAESDRRKIVYKDYDELPEFTWEDMNERVQRGALLVVCDGLVVDIRKWIRVHPGGTKILEKVIGTDITNEFYNTHKKTSIVEDVETPETQLLSTHTSLERCDTLEQQQKLGKLIKNQNVAKLVDKINTKYFSNSPLATHKHSAFATKKMLDLVIGRINENPPSEPPDSPSFNPVKFRESTEYDDDNLMSQRIKFRRYKLTSRSTVNGSKKFPVIKFTFTKIFRDENDWDEVFLPGHYIEVKSLVEGQVVVRSYTPVEGRLSKSFSIYVKIYPNGLMTTHLSEQLKGFEIQVRGPFDVSGRLKLANNAQVQGEMLNKVIFRSSTSPTSPTFLTKLAKSSLLNPNSVDGCWDELFMICGGTGITPMLQLIKYHLLHAKKSESIKKRDRIINMHLLYGNKGVEDVIDRGALREYESSSGGMLEISYVFSDPPEVWQSFLQGKITPDIVQKWFSDIKSKKLGIQSGSTFQPFPQAGASSSTTYPPQIPSSLKLPKLGSSKIVVCGPAEMMIIVNQTLIEMGYSDNDYIILI